MGARIKRGRAGEQVSIHWEQGQKHGAGARGKLPIPITAAQASPEATAVTTDSAQPLT